MASEEAIDIASGFILDAPPGELQDVMADIKTIVDDPAIIRALDPAVEQYNKEQLTSVTLPGGSQPVIVSDHNALGDNRFFDVESQSEFTFDHHTLKASDVKSWTLESQHADLIKSLLRLLSTHVREHYPSSPAYTVCPTAGDATLTLCIVGSKFSPGNFVNGRWRSVYTFDPATRQLAGKINVDVHYYEDGNVRLLTTKPVEVELPAAEAREVVKAVAAAEKRYQEELNRAFGQLSEGAFKSLRRQLPVTRQKIDWEKIGSYRLGQEVGGASARR